MKIDAENYIFIGDDVCLHPELSEGKLNQMLGFQGKKVFVTGIWNVNIPYLFRWPHARESSIPFFQRGTRWKASIPTYMEAMQLFENFNGRNTAKNIRMTFLREDMKEKATKNIRMQ